jgi:hypothetical protein
MCQQESVWQEVEAQLPVNQKHLEVADTLLKELAGVMIDVKRFQVLEGQVCYVHERNR